MQQRRWFICRQQVAVNQQGTSLDQCHQTGHQIGKFGVLCVQVDAGKQGLRHRDQRTIAGHLRICTHQLLHGALSQQRLLGLPELHGLLGAGFTTLLAQAFAEQTEFSQESFKQLATALGVEGLKGHQGPMAIDGFNCANGTGQAALDSLQHAESLAIGQHDLKPLRRLMGDGARVFRSGRADALLGLIPNHAQQLAGHAQLAQTALDQQAAQAAHSWILEFGFKGQALLIDLPRSTAEQPLPQSLGQAG